jgi:hypothetical protein
MPLTRPPCPLLLRIHQPASGSSTSPEPADELLDDRDHRDGLLSEEEEEEEEQEEETRPLKQRRVAYTLEETYRLVEDQQLLVERYRNGSPLSMTVLADRLVSGLRTKSSQPGTDFPDADLAILGSAFFVDVFGDSGQKNFFRCVKDSGRPARQAVRAAWVTARARQELEALGQPALATLAHSWSLVVSSDESRRSALGRMFLARQKVGLVQQWLRFDKLPAGERDELSAFLTSRGHPPGRRRSLDSRLGAYMAELLQLPTTRNFSDRIYRWKPLAILVDTFGLGILPFIPSTFEAKYRKLTSKGPMSKEEKLATAAGLLLKVFPELKKVCVLAEERFVGPVLRGDVPTVSWDARASLDKEQRPIVLEYLEAPLTYDPLAADRASVARSRAGSDNGSTAEDGSEPESSSAEDGSGPESSSAEDGSGLESLPY